MGAASPISESTRRALLAVVDSSVRDLAPDYRRALRSVLALPADRLAALVRSERRPAAFVASEPAQSGAEAPLLVSRTEAARLLGRSVRMVDLLAAQGLLTRCTLPAGGRRGRAQAKARRALGITSASIRLLVRQWSGDEGRVV